MEMKITFRSPTILLSWNKPTLSPFYYYRDLTNGTTQVSYRMPLSGPTLKYTDTPTFSWTLTSEKKVISGYETQRATWQFRGRSYEAWFTPSIPISADPNFFGGLPGLILKLHNMNGALRRSC
ncbi:MAG: GLPGLI family protein [Porphyromonadaceae bacterium]|nr:GLPGLI family protein [Porphyromonadaceae bacterium]